MEAVILLLVVALPIAWLVSEFLDKRWLRISLGCCTIAMAFGVAYLVGSLERLNSNAWFGDASQKLVNSTLEQLEAGNTDAVRDNLKWFQTQYHPTYENRARYDQLGSVDIQLV